MRCLTWVHDVDFRLADSWKRSVGTFAKCRPKRKWLGVRVSSSWLSLLTWKQIKDIGLIFTASMSWNFYLERAVKKGFQKLNHLRRVIPRTTKETVKCTLVKTYIFSAVFYASHVWNPGPQYLQRLERLQRSCLKWITCLSVPGDKEYVESLIRNRLLPVTYFLVLNDLILLNKILMGLTSMNASDHWSITFGCAKTRSSQKFFIEARKTFRKRSEDNYFNRVARFNNSLSPLNSFANHSSYKNPCQFRREVKIFLEGKALKRFKNKSYRSGWKVIEKFYLLKLDFSPNLGATKLVVNMFGWIQYYYYYESMVWNLQDNPPP